MPASSSRREKTTSAPTRVQPDRAVKFKKSAPPAKEEPVCSICWDTIKAKDSTKIDCCHIYHQECIKKWIDVPNRTCPNCRATVTFMQCGSTKFEVAALPLQPRVPSALLVSVTLDRIEDQLAAIMRDIDGLAPAEQQAALASAIDRVNDSAAVALATLTADNMLTTRREHGEPSVPSRVQPARVSKVKTQPPQPAANEAPTCSICLGKLPKKVTTIDCSHAFHQACIKQWIDVPNRSCPNCRAPVTFMQCGKEKTAVEPIEEPLPHVRSVPRFPPPDGLDFGPRVWSPFARLPSPTSDDDDPPRTAVLSFTALTERAAAVSDFSRFTIQIPYGGQLTISGSHSSAALLPGYTP